MAALTLSLFLLLSSLTFSPFTTFSRHLPLTFKSSSLNITASLHQITSSSPATHLSEHRIHSPAFSPSSSLTLTLHSRTSLLNPNRTHHNLKSKLLTQLARDSLRVNSLQTRLDLTLRRTTTNAFESPIVSGTSQGSGEYFTRVGLGRPPRQLYVVIDTGSDVSWVQCSPCSECYSQSDPIFDPITSSSFLSLPCDSPKCGDLDVSECRGDRCLYEVSYGDGSFTAGDFATETVTFSGGGTVDNVAVGCGHSNEGLFVGAAGLLGLGGGALSLPSQLNATSFSYCLVDRESDSASTLEFNSAGSPSEASFDSVSAELIKNPQMESFYYVGLTGIAVGGNVLELPATAFQINGDGNGGVIVDSGTAVTRLESVVYESLRDEFRRGASHLRVAEGVALFDTCYDLSGKTSVEVPAVEFQFAGGKRLTLPAKNYMIPVDEQGTFCLAFAGTTSSMSIIGNVQQQGTRVGFDLVNHVVTFEPNRC